MRRIGRWLSVLVCALMIIACGATPSTESAGEFFDSTALTTKVKASLIDELGSSGFAIQVKTFKDEVQLSGFVGSKEVRQHAAIVAAGVGGVKRVRNAIIVK
ncbi:MAG: transporter [Legionellales bacterium RIFCSPHIGHO2_12_FULL_42_9]|nr:MAG: transporter [Legionellales bacterium RIFCSPHIGHO2_12_FULL_42_9]